MKTFIFLLFGVTVASAQTQSLYANVGAANVATNPVSQTIVGYQTGVQDGNSQVWQKIVQSTDDQGNVTYQTNDAYTELATGLNHLVNGQWVESKEEVDISAAGNSALATNGQHQAYFPGDIYSGQIELVTPDGKQLYSRPVGLSYFDGTNSVLIAKLTNSTGEVTGNNQVIYANAFTDFGADIRYTYTKAGFEQDIILREQPPSPASYGLNPDTTRLQVLTEFFNPPQPTVSATTVSTDAGDLENDNLGFGIMRMIPGKAFLLGTTTPSVAVNKQWLLLDGRQLLVEEVPVFSIAGELENLPLPQTTSTQTNPPLNVVSTKRLLPEQHLATTPDKHPMQLAQAIPSSRGLVLDYVTLNYDTNNCTFQGDTTYFISGPVNLGGTNTFEGGTVIKYTNSSSAGISISPVAPIFQTGLYRPAIFTTMDDNSVGAAITGSTGSPTNAGATFLTINLVTGSTEETAFPYLRFTCAGLALQYNYISSPCPVENCQFVNCYLALEVYNGSEYISSNPLLIYNVLFSQCSYVLNSEQNLIGVNITADQIDEFYDIDSDSYLTNCIFTAVSDLYGGGTLDHCLQADSGSGIYQTVGAGNYYLAADSTNRNAGTTNIDSSLLAELKQKTTYPPLLLTNQTISVSTNLNPYALRDTNSSPDLGYHYDPIDYLVTQYGITNNSTLTITNGTAIAYYDTGGLWLQDSSSIVSIGTPLNPNWFVRYQSVQEQPVSLDGLSPSGSWLEPYHYGAGAPSGYFRFSKFACPAGGGYHLYDSSYPDNYSNLTVRDCEFWSGQNYFKGGTNSVMTVNNNLFDRSAFNALGGGINSSLSLSNNLFWGDGFAGSSSKIQISPPAGSVWYAFNNDFDTCYIGSATCTNGYNAYLNCTNWINPTNSTDIITNVGLAYQTSWLGTFYQPTNSPLIHMGNTNANLMGLYHYTVTTNEVVEGTNIVSIGYHYVAADVYGNPLDTDGDGIPDYVEDANGDGVYDAGDLSNWLDYYNGVLPNLTIVGGNNQSGMPNTFLTLPLTVSVAGTNGAVLTNAPLTFAVTLGGAQISTTNNGTTTNSINVRSGNNGLASVFVLLPSTLNTTNDITVTAWSGTNSIQVTFIATTMQGVKLWLRADAGVTTNGAGQISTWADQSGNTNNATQGTTTNQPIYITDVLNGLPLIRFYGSNYFSLPSTLFSEVTGAEAFVVLKVATNPPSTSQSFWGWGGNNSYTYYPDTNGNVLEDFGSTTLHTVGSPAQPLNQYHLYEVAGQTNFWGAWINGVLQSSTTNNAYGTWDLYYLGGGKSHQHPFSGDIAEVLMFNRTLSASDRLTVNNYLNLKYGLVTNAPATPTNLVASAISTNQISLTWNFSLGTRSTMFEIERATTSNGVYTVVATVQDATSYLDTNLSAGTTYYYEVAAANAAGVSGNSSVAWATTLTSGGSLPLGNLLLWLKADTGIVRQSTNGSVATWFDQSGNHNDGSQSTATNQPIYITDVLNGLPLIRFYGSNYFSLPSTLLNGTTGAEAFVVLKMATNPPSTNQSFWGWGGNNSYTYYPDTNGNVLEDFGSTTLHTVGSPAQPLNQYHLYEVAGQTNFWGAWINGVLQSSTTNNAYGTWDLYYLGGGKSHQHPFSGDIAEVLVFNRTLSVDERDTVSGYLTAKYGLAQFATNNVPPSSPTNFFTTGIASYQLNLQWLPTTTNVSSYHIERELGTNGTYQEIGAVPSYLTNFVDTTAYPTNVYSYQIRAHNLFGDAYSAVISPPTINLTNWPATILELGTNQIVAQAGDAYGTVSNVVFFANNGFNGMIGTATSAPYLVNWIPRMEGNWYLTALATDNLGNSQVSLPVTVTIYLDSNGDGIPDIFEVQSGNDPINPWIPPAFNTNDHTAPIITLLIPTNAIVVP